MHNDEAMPRNVELQATTEDSMIEMATWAALTNSGQCSRTTSDLAYALEQAVQRMGLMRQNRSAVAQALVEHVRELSAITKKWADEADASPGIHVEHMPRHGKGHGCGSGSSASK